MSTVTHSLSQVEKFDNAAAVYNETADIQKQVADRLIASLNPWKDILPPGPILELGCGTGFTSRGLVELFPERPLILSDASRNMLEACKSNIGEVDNVEYTIQDGEEIPVQEPTYAMTISSFVAQWFHQPAFTLGQWLEATKPGGLLLAAFPGSESFPEWKKHAQTLGIPFTRNALPDTEEMVIKLSSDITQIDYYEDTITQKFEGAAAFFRHLKQIGAGCQLNGRSLTAREMKMLIDYWDEQKSDGITVSWHVVFLAVKRSMV